MAAEYYAIIIDLSDTNQCIPVGIDMIALFMAIRDICTMEACFSCLFYIELLGYRVAHLDPHISAHYLKQAWEQS